MSAEPQDAEHTHRWRRVAVIDGHDVDPMQDRRLRERSRDERGLRGGTRRLVAQPEDQQSRTQPTGEQAEVDYAVSDGVRKRKEIHDPIGDQQRKPRPTRQERIARQSRRSSARIPLASAGSS